MDIFKLDLDARHGIIDVYISYKPIKNAHLKISRDLKVKLSVPENACQTWAENILVTKKIWIAKQLEKYKQAQGHNDLLDIQHGTSTQFLGKDVRILKKKGETEFIEQKIKSIHVYLHDITDNEKFSALFAKFWRDKAKEIFSEQIEIFYLKIFKKYKIEKPSLCIKKMQTLWGSCTQKRNKITLNEYLLKADILCIQYVILHELTHLLYKEHSKEFYAFLTVHMPNWEERKKRLDKEVVQGL